MIRYAAVFILGVALASAEKQQDKNKTETAVTAIPAGATESSPGLFTHTDAAGKTWLYRKTPFGVVKSAEPPASTPASQPAEAPRGNPFGEIKAAAGAASTASVTAVEDGDSYKFERTTPFGPTRWTRKRSELTADEQEIVRRLKPQKAANAGTKE
jgi:hypothetical protein